MNEDLRFKATGREYFDRKYNLDYCFNNPRTVGIMNIHVFEQIKKSNELLSVIINLLNKERNIDGKKENKSE